MIACDGGRCALQGALTMVNVTALRDEGVRLFTAPEVTVDLAAVTEVDSTALSLLFEWRRAAHSAGRRIAFVNLPDNLRSLAALYGVTELLGEERGEGREA
ncbi:MAG: STAS domain-containing protein [Pseudomonadota bacterium]